jgi:hypothetical protein
MSYARLKKEVDRLIGFLEAPDLVVVIDDDDNRTMFCYNQEVLRDMLVRLRMEENSDDELKVRSVRSKEAISQS